jgi:hypothetical protein
MAAARRRDISGSLQKLDLGNLPPMKYLYDNSKTRKELLVWSQDSPLIVAPFFFWKAGTTMQKSQIGLLQSLFHQTLSQCEELIPTVLPEWYHEYQFYDQRGEVLMLGMDSRRIVEGFHMSSDSNHSPCEFLFSY